MPKYRVRSGELAHMVETRYPAKPKEIAMLAILAQPQAKSLGQLTEISGGEYRGDNVTYLLTERVLQSMGMMKAGG